ncbi:MAG: DUF6434 domain-containing protein [Myxococcota bacterium]|nr:DUF6434 domain-containing protein [Myxococcota bacterium]
MTPRPSLASQLDRDFMAWMKTAEGKTMGAATQEWLRREKAKAEDEPSVRARQNQ